MPHIHSIYDTDPHFSIDSEAKTITNLSETKTVIVQGDHNSERFTFECPRYIDGHDMSTCNQVQVHYLNVDQVTRDKYFGLYEVDDFQISPADENVVICSWLISSNATQYIGSLSFALHFVCRTDTIVDYAWNTAVHADVSVVEGINSGEPIVIEYADIMAVWKEELAKQQLVSLKQTETSEEEFGKNVITATYGDGRTENFVVRNGGPGPKGDSSFSAEVKDGVLVVEGFAALPSWEGGSY